MSSYSPSNLIINYLPQNMSERELFSMFVTIGPIEKCRVMKDNKTGYSYGFGFVNYVNPEDAARAIQQLNGQEIYNKRIKVSYARPSTEDIKETNLYVTNLPRHYNEVDLDNLFEPYGKIVQKNLLLDKYTKMPRGVAFVRYDKREEAKEAVKNLDGYIPEDGHEALSVKVAAEHGKQKAAFYAGWQAGVQQTRGGGGFNLNGRGGAVMRGGSNVHGGSIMCGRGMMRGGGVVRGGGVMRGGGRGARNNNGINNLVTYPIRTTTGFGALRQEKMQQRYNPLSFGGGMPNNGYSAF